MPVIVAVATITLLYVEWQTDKPTVVLAVLIILALGLGWLLPARYFVAGLYFGLVIVTAHILSSVTGSLIPRYQRHAFTAGDWLAMTLLIVPAIFASFTGSRLAKWS